MGDCKRLTVRSLGFSENSVEHSVNFNQTECTGEAGKCGCVHAEMNLLKNMPNPEIVIVSHSPCLDCAKALVQAGVQAVYFVHPYRLMEGIEFLIRNGVVVTHLTEMGAKQL